MGNAAKKTLEEMRADYYRKHLGQVVGGTIIASGADEMDGDSPNDRPWQVLEVCMPDGKVFQVVSSRDTEGNGPGHLFIDKAPNTRALPPQSELVCDWGYCNQRAVGERASSKGWLPVCNKHKRAKSVPK